MKHFTACLVPVVCFAAQAADDKDINKYLVDINGGAVSAVGLIDAAGTAITPIESSQDLIVALVPLVSRDGSKNAFGLAVTPAKTTLVPMSGRTYVGSWYARLAGNLTLSYAQNKADYAGQSYTKSAFAVDTVYFFKLEDDPVYQSSVAFKRCADLKNDYGEREKALNDQHRNRTLTDKEFQDALVKLLEERDTQLTACIDADLAALAAAKWNSGRMSISYGQGRIRGGGGSYSLGNAVSLNAQYPVGDKAVTQISLRHARNALDLDTIGTATPTFKSARLAAMRITYGDQGESSLRAMAEVSSARSSSASAFGQAFIYAVGIDKKLMKGAWLEFRLGRNRSMVDGKEQTTSLLGLNVAPTLFEFKR